MYLVGQSKGVEGKATRSFTINTVQESIELSTLYWTTEPPTEKGTYRAIHKDGTEYWAEFVDDVVWLFGDDVPRDPADFPHWLGPLPVPEPPKE